MADLKVTRFVIGGETYAIPSAAADQKGLMSASDFTKLANIAEKAQVNVLEGVNVNGTALAIANKIVDILVATGSANGNIAVNGVDVPVKGLAALAYKANVSSAELDAALKAVIDGHGTAIETLNGTGVGSVKKAVDDAINKFATDVTDDDVVNSYKELIDWAAAHGSDAAEMAASIQTLEGLLTGIGGEENPATVNAAITAAINALDLTSKFAAKVDKVEGYGLSKNDFTDALKSKLDSIDTDAKKITCSYDAATETLTIAGVTATV